jgi:hypothetical protein
MASHLLVVGVSGVGAVLSAGVVAGFAAAGFTRVPA